MIIPMVAFIKCVSIIHTG